MNKECVCLSCYHPSCPAPYLNLPYDEVSHQVNNNFINVRVAKDARRFETDDPRLKADRNPFDLSGGTSTPGCRKLNVIPNEQPPPKDACEETLSLRTVRQIMANDDLRNTLEIEFKGPRNYLPLPEPGPSPGPIQPVIKTGGKSKGKGSKKSKKKKKKK